MDNNIPPAPHVWPDGFDPNVHNHQPNIAQVPVEPNIWPPGVAVHNNNGHLNHFHHPPQHYQVPARGKHFKEILGVLVLSLIVAGIISAVLVIIINSNSDSRVNASWPNGSSSYSYSSSPSGYQGTSRNGDFSNKINNLINSIDNFVSNK
jgi:hypothetical protein